MKTWLSWFLVVAVLFICSPLANAADAPPKKKKIVLIAGKKSHGPEGNGIHDYGWSVRLLKVMLDNSNVKDAVQVEYHLNGWPRNPATLEDADTIMVISDGRDGDKFEEAPFLASPERVRFMEKQMKRGCGFLTFHFSTFAPEAYSKQILAWTGGYFQWEQAGKRQWYSAIRTVEADVELPTKDHPVVNGIKSFRMREEFYYNLRFGKEDRGLKPLLTVPTLKGRVGDGNVVAWAKVRADGGRGFGTTCGHFYDNWKNPAFRKLILNAILWTAKAEVPKAGVEAKFYTHEEIRKALGEKPPEKKTSTVRVLLIAGNEAHKWHNWEKTTPRIREALEKDGRIKVDVSTDIEDLVKKDLKSYQVVLLNSYCNWQDPKGISDKARTAFTSFLRDGGGLILVHFANGAFHYSLPKAKDSDWPEYRKIVRRVWNHTPPKGKPVSGHDAFGRFTVMPTMTKHAITTGLRRFEVVDELYFRQDGEEPIIPLIVAESKVTKKLEPLAWTYTYGKGRIFQTLLGHSEKTYDAPEACEMLRRATMWAANQPVKSTLP